MSEPRTPPRTLQGVSMQSHHQISNITSPTAYHGAAGIFDDQDKDATTAFRNVRMNERPTSSTQPSTPTTLGSRILSGATSLARSGSTLHSRTRSWVPKLNNNNTTNTSSNNSTPERRPPSQGNRLFNDLFSGESAPVRLGVPTSSLDDLEDSEFVMEHQTEFTPRPMSRRKTSVMSVSNSASKSGPKSWFGRKETQPAPSSAAPDEILKEGFINSSLFPHGTPDPLSPHAFNDLLLNATALLERFQTAYKEKVDFLESIRPEMEAQKEEVLEAQTRADHLKMQLEDLAQKAEEQKQVNLELVQQIAEEKVKSQEVVNTIRLVRSDAQGGADDESRRGKRRSAGSAADSGFESDTDRDTDVSSVFSSGIQTPVSMHQPQVIVSPENMYDGSSWNVTPTKNGHERVNTLAGGTGARGAWATVEQLRHENAGLRSEVENLRNGMQGVIDFVSR